MPILRTELRRASEFSRYAQNRASHYRLQEVASQLRVNMVDEPATDFEELDSD